MAVEDFRWQTGAAGYLVGFDGGIVGAGGGCLVLVGVRVTLQRLRGCDYQVSHETQWGGFERNNKVL